MNLITIAITLASILALILIYTFVYYNISISKKIMIEEAFSIMDVQLKKRFDLVRKFSGNS
jgi:LemA family.